MTYKYICPHCEKETIIEKSIYSSSRVEYCDVCQNELKRVYESPCIITNDGIKNN